MKEEISKCPECEAQVQATRVEYLYGVTFGPDKGAWSSPDPIEGMDEAIEEAGLQFGAAGPEDFYCANGHDLNHFVKLDEEEKDEIRALMLRLREDRRSTEALPDEENQ